MTASEIVSSFAVLSNSKAVITDGMLLGKIKANPFLISDQLAYIFNVSFTQGVFLKFLKESIVPMHICGSHFEPGNYRPILY